MSGLRTYSTSGPVCPYCGHDHRADEPFLYDEDTDEMECESCGTIFNMQVYHSTSWTCTSKEPRP